MSLFFQKGGILTTIQDLGRNGFRRFGINPNGAMDKTAVRLINILLGNPEDEAVMEIHFPAPVLQFGENAIISIGGADFGAELGERPLENWRPVFIRRGQTLSFSTKKAGARAYLSVKGGFEIEDWLNSKSTNLPAKTGGFRGRSLTKDDRVLFREKVGNQSPEFDYFISRSLIPEYKPAPSIRIIPGAEFELLTRPGNEILSSGEFRISAESNRMGFRLSGDALYLRDKIELVSTAVDFGTVQLLPGGQMVILMADHQTSGGYPRVAHVISKDLPILAQLGAADKIRFELISLKEAEELSCDFEKKLDIFKIGCKFKQNQ